MVFHLGQYHEPFPVLDWKIWITMVVMELSKDMEQLKNATGPSLISRSKVEWHPEEEELIRLAEEEVSEFSPLS